MMAIDEFYAVVTTLMIRELNDRGVASKTVEIAHWTVLEDSSGVAIAPTVQGALPAHELLRSYMAEGVCAAAYVTYVQTGPERLVAYAEVADPADSDVRQCRVLRGRHGVALGAWEHTV
jgi:hypothetical protein